MRTLRSIFIQTRTIGAALFTYGVSTCLVVVLFSSEASSAPACRLVFSKKPALVTATFPEVVRVMERSPYRDDQLPVIPLRMFKWIGNRLTFYVAERSKDILENKSDYRVQGLEKPIHPMGVGLVGRMEMLPSRWTGVFRGGSFPIVARASISQGNPYKMDSDGRMQKRSTAMAIKVFRSDSSTLTEPTANAVFQNNLNGLLGSTHQPLNYLESTQTNQPGLDFTQIRRLYEIETLLGVAYGSITRPLDRTNGVPFINPQIRPVHSFAEFGENDPGQVKTPIWVKIAPKLKAGRPVEESDFRLEIAKTLARDGSIEFEFFAADAQDSRGEKLWERVGRIVFDRSILSAGVDQNLLFPHDSLNSSFTGRDFKIPTRSSQFDQSPEDTQ